MRYSFQNFYATLNGPGGSVNCGYGAAVAEEGVSFEPVGAKSAMVTGADGRAVHQLYAGNPYTIKVKLMKTSPQNAILSAMYNLQTFDVALHGINVFAGSHVVQQDYAMAIEVAFQGPPTILYGKDAGMNEWTFDAGQCTVILGPGLFAF